MFLGWLLHRPAASRRGIWSSDRRIGCRRVPVQPLEAALAVAAGLAALAVVLLLRPARTGSVAVAAYTLGRQFLLGLRADPPRRSPRSGLVTAAAAAAVLDRQHHRLRPGSGLMLPHTAQAPQWRTVPPPRAAPRC